VCGWLGGGVEKREIRRERDMGEKEMKKVVVVGGSIAGLSCAHAFLKAKGWEVVVLEKARSVSSAGAGLGLDPEACDALKDWGIGDGLLQQSLPLSIEEVSLLFQYQQQQKNTRKLLPSLLFYYVHFYALLLLLLLLLHHV
jgi:2-polyprenyl-6-methoxyphenol hydroxylase-like FAD-dependent oxidoreductase